MPVPMRPLFYLAFLSFCFLFASCMPDHCKDTVCDYGGVCIDGHCSCLNGYEGAKCDELWNARFLGNWNSKDKVVGGELTTEYEISLVSNGDPSQFLLMNLGNGVDSVLCRRKGYYEFAMLEGQNPDSNTMIASGSGVIDTTGKTVTAKYTIQTEDTTLSYNMTWTKE